MSPRSSADRLLETLHLVRHAHAGDPTSWQGPDELRPLSAKGRRQAERLGSFLARADIRPDKLISSPKLRALQTAQLLGASLRLEVDVDERLSGGCTLACLESVVGDAGARAPMVFGHDPDFSLLLSELIGSTLQEMRKGALASVDVQLPLRAGGGTLRWLVPPELLVERGT